MHSILRAFLKTGFILSIALCFQSCSSVGNGGDPKNNLCHCKASEQCHKCVPSLGCPPKRAGGKCAICNGR
jgi:hypothetical protein